jgi:2-C-methyl-D-erythritol 4-phosphate cytidylyltransferase
MHSPDSALGAQPATAHCYALVPCAGVGARSGAAVPKQYVELAGQALVAHTLRALGQVPGLAAVLVVLSPQDDVFEQAVPGFVGEAAWIARCGGNTRAESVQAGLAELRRRGATATDWVLVHDAARCLIQAKWVQGLMDTCRNDAVGGLLALPLADTLKAADDGCLGHCPALPRAVDTLERSGKWAAQTPQMFRLGLLEQALRQAHETGRVVTDESSAIEALGLHPLLVEGCLENFKVTWPADFALAHRLLQAPQPGPSLGPVGGAAPSD